jgi:hypothetical protein
MEVMDATQNLSPAHQFFNELCERIVIATWSSVGADAMRYNLLREMFAFMVAQYDVWSANQELCGVVMGLYEHRYMYLNDDDDQRPQDHSEILAFLRSLRNGEDVGGNNDD